MNDSLKIIEKVYLHIDRDCYYPGDVVWFKSYVVDASNNKPFSFSKNLHVELISPSSEIIQSRVVKIEAGIGNGDFHLPDSLALGHYQIRAYTNNMRNFDDQLFFYKSIDIINSIDVGNKIKENTGDLNSKIDINYFPEGGSLVDYVSSAVAFKAVNASGTGCDVSGEVYSSSGEMITTFKSSHCGMGIFSLRPAQGLNHYAIVKTTDGQEMRSDIPKSFSTGIVLSVSINQNNEHVLTIKTNSQTLPLILDNDLTLTISARKTILKKLNFKIKSFTNSYVLPVDDLPNGIIMLTLSGVNDLPLCERLVYVQNNKNIGVTIETDKKIYEKRDSVSVRISISEDSKSEKEAFLSLSASDKLYSYNPSRFPSTISSWFLLESDVHGPVEDPSYYFDLSNPNRLIDLDLLLRTQGWRDFEWKYQEASFQPENGFTISGRVRKLFKNEPLKNSSVSVLIEKSKNILTTTVPTDSLGRFKLEFSELTDSARLIVNSVGKNERNKGWLLLDSLNYSPAKIQHVAPKNFFASEPQIKEESLPVIKQAEAIRKTIKKRYTLSDTILLNDVDVFERKKDNPQKAQIKRSRLLYLEPDNELIMTPQIANATFHNPIESLIGRISGISLVYPINEKDSGIRLRGGEPAFMVDGHIVPYDYISTIPANCIDRIDVLKTSRTTAIFGFNGALGVISVILKTYDRIPPYPLLYSANVKISGYNSPRVFYSPKHSSDLESNQNPDLRTTLFWEPNIKTKTNNDFYLKYFNADNPSTIKIIVEGITEDGIPVSGNTEYEIR